MGLNNVELRCGVVKAIAKVFDGRQQGRDVFALRLGLADVLRAGIAFALQLLSGDLQFLTAIFKQLIRRSIKLEATAGELVCNVCGGLSE